MGYVDTTVVILYWNPYQTFVIHRYHHFWFDEYNSHLSIEYKHTPGYLLLQQYPESLIHNSELLNFISCEIYLIYPPFCDTIMITYEIELPPDGNKIGINLLYDKYFTIPYVTGTTPNSPSGNQLPTQANKMCGLLLSMEKNLSQLKAHVMNSISVKFHVENTK